MSRAALPLDSGKSGPVTWRGPPWSFSSQAPSHKARSHGAKEMRPHGPHDSPLLGQVLGVQNSGTPSLSSTEPFPKAAQVSPLALPC